MCLHIFFVPFVINMPHEECPLQKNCKIAGLFCTPDWKSYLDCRLKAVEKNVKDEKEFLRDHISKTDPAPGAILRSYMKKKDEELGQNTPCYTFPSDIEKKWGGGVYFCGEPPPDWNVEAVDYRPDDICSITYDGIVCADESNKVNRLLAISNINEDIIHSSLNKRIEQVAGNT